MYLLLQLIDSRKVNRYFYLHTKRNAMKRLLTICLLGTFTSAFAQQKLKVDNAQLLKTQSFAFVATSIEKRPGTDGSSGYNFDMSAYGTAVVASTTSIQQSLAYTSNTTGPGSAYTDKYYESAAGDGSYFTAYGIPLAKGAKKQLNLDTSAVYFNWKGSKLVLSNVENPKTLNDINSSSFAVIPSVNVKTKLSSKKDGSSRLILKINADKDYKIFYLNVQSDGKAVLQTPPNKHESTYIHGYIMPKLD
jgi:hypothetical protein